MRNSFQTPFIIALVFAISSAAPARLCSEQLISLQAFQLNLFLGNDLLTFDWEVLSDAVLSPGRWQELKDTPGCRSALLLPFSQDCTLLTGEEKLTKL